MALVNESTAIIDIGVDVAAIAASSIDTASDTLFVRDVSASGTAQFRQITLDQASTLFGGTAPLLNPTSVGSWTSDLASNPPTSAGQQRHYWDSSGNYAQYIADSGPTWRFVHGRRIGDATSPLSAITPWGVGQIYLARSADGYGTISVGSSSVWLALGTTAASWIQLA